eukprot:scaffold60997_cov18-Tisochrysis_lutea.AAC.3
MRMHNHRVAYLELRGATVLAQRTWRSAHAKSQARAAAAHERAHLAAAMHLQAVYRAKKVHDSCHAPAGGVQGRRAPAGGVQG